MCGGGIEEGEKYHEHKHTKIHPPEDAKTGSKPDGRFPRLERTPEGVRGLGWNARVHAEALFNARADLHSWDSLVVVRDTQRPSNQTPATMSHRRSSPSVYTPLNPCRIIL